VEVLSVCEEPNLIEKARRSWRIIRDFQAGIDYEINDIRAALVDLRDALSELRVITATSGRLQGAEKFAEEFSGVISHIINNLDAALLGVEILSKETIRAWLALMLYGIDMEAVLTLFAFILRPF